MTHDQNYNARISAYQSREAYERGFKAGTEDFRNSVLELLKPLPERDKTLEKIIQAVREL